MRVICKPISMAGLALDNEASVVFTEPISSLLHSLDLKIRSDYYTSFNRRSLKAYNASAEEYLFGKHKRWSDKSLVCPEMPLPRILTQAVRLRMQHGSACSEQAVALVHAGRKESMTPIHFDWDHKWIAHACLAGRKRLFLFPPDAGWLLCPIINTSALAIPKFSESDRSDLIRRLGGIELVLQAGEGILFPSMFWHGALYDEPSLSVSVRFETRLGGRPFAVLPRSWLLQRLAWGFFAEGFDSNAQEFLVEYLKSFFSRTRTWKERYRRVIDLCRGTLLARGEERGVLEWISERFSPELALASEELKLYYGNAAARKPHDKDRIHETREYVFQGLNGVSAAHELLLSKYALSLRQGLRPKRGLIEIEQE